MAKKMSAGTPKMVGAGTTGTAGMKPIAPAAAPSKSNPISRLGAYAHPPKKKSGKK